MSADPPGWAPFDPADLQSRGIAARLIARLLDDPRWLYRLLRLLWPMPRIPFTRWRGVLRFADVEEVLLAQDVFQVPFGPKVRALNDGANFLLGMQDSDEYGALHQSVMAALPRADLATIVAPMMAQAARDVVEGANGGIDIVQDLLMPLPILLCERYYGVAVPDRVAFAQWTIAMSTYMFGDPGDSEATRRAAMAGGQRVRAVVDAAISAAHAAPDPDTVIGRMVALQAAGDAAMTDLAIRACLIGLITGFVPTNLMASGHIAEILLRRPAFLAAAHVAARADDDMRLERCLFEAMRFRPLNPGPFRVCVRDITVATGTRRASRFRAGDRVLVGTHSAMFDPARVDRPDQFDPARDPALSLLFGYGLHVCVGEPLARTQITQTLKPLLRLPTLALAGKPESFGPFPWKLPARF